MKEMLSAALPASAWCWGDGYVLDPGRRRLTRHGAPVSVDDRALDLIILLLQNQTRAVERREFIAAIWNGRPVSDNTVRHLVCKARRAVGDDGEQQAVIATQYGRSLKWIAPLEVLLDPESRRAGTAEEGTLPAGASVSATTAVGADKPQPKRSRPARGWHYLAATAVVLLLVGLIAVPTATRKDSQPPLTAPPALPPASPAAVPGKGRVTLAVLPFLVGNTDPHDSYLGDGIAEEIITRLGRFPNLRVAARTSSFLFRGEAADIRQAGRELGVSHVLEGSVQRAGKRLRVRVTLVDASDGYARWTAEYNADAGDVFKVEDEVATAVLRALQPKIASGEIAPTPPARAPFAIDPAAHDAYLMGLQYLRRRTVPDVRKALDYFQRAIAIEPDYAAAWSGIATAYNLWHEGDSDNPPDTHYADGLRAAKRAVQLDPHLARAHLALAILHEAHWEWEPAEREFQRALQLDPSDADAHQRYGAFQWYMRDRTKALAEMRIAFQLDPLSPIIQTDLGRALMFNGQFDAAIAQLEQTIKLDPTFSLAHLVLAQAYMAKERKTEGLREIRTAISLRQPLSASYITVYGVILYYCGDVAGAREQLRILEARQRQHYVSGASLALLQGVLADKDQMFANLARAVADHDAMLRPAVAARRSPWYGDPRFNALLLKMGLSADY